MALSPLSALPVSSSLIEKTSISIAPMDISEEGKPMEISEEGKDAEEWKAFIELISHRYRNVVGKIGWKEVLTLPKTELLKFSGVGNVIADHIIDARSKRQKLSK